MSDCTPDISPRDPLAPTLRSHTPARVALSTTGSSLATAVALDFALAHAQARDAVHSTLDVAVLLTALRERGLSAISLHSAASTRTEYLRRPDLGRTLAAASTTFLFNPTYKDELSSRPEAEQPGAPSIESYRMGGLSFAEADDRPSPAQPTPPSLQPATRNLQLAIILADGLSALATQTHAIPLLDELLPMLDTAAWSLTPIVLAQQARVAISDPIGQALHADATVILIGERPGLSSPDSLGAYITWHPRPGRTDAERNCISNIRQSGLDYSTAARKIAWYLTQARRLCLTGVALREPDTALLNP